MMGVLVGLLCAATWAVGSVMMAPLSKKLDPFTMNAPRSLVGGLVILLFALATGRTSTYPMLTLERLFFLLASVGLGGAIGDSLYVVSLSRIGVSRAFPLASTYPALTLVLAVLFLKERIDPAVVAGLFLVAGGTFSLGRSLAGSETEVPRPRRASGVAYALVASLCWAVSVILLAPGIQGLDPIMVSSIRTPALSLMLWGVVATRKTWPELRKLSGGEWALLTVGGFVGWGLGSLFFLATVSLAGPTRAAILTSTSPLFALPLSVVFLKEKANAAVLLGSVLTVGGVILAS